MSFPERAAIVLEAEEERRSLWACEERNNFTGEFSHFYFMSKLRESAHYFDPGPVFDLL